MRRNHDQHAKEHEYFAELCVLSTSGDLSAAEWEELRRHLAECQECSRQMEQYGELVTSGATSLFGDSIEPDESGTEGWSQEDAKRELLARVGAITGGENPPPPVPSRWNLAPTFIYATLLLLAVLGTAAGFRWGLQKGRDEHPPTLAALPNRPGELNELLVERDALNRQLTLQARTIDQLSASVQQRTQEVSDLNATKTSANDRYQALSEREQAEAEQISVLENQQNALRSNLEQTSTALRDTQTELASLRSQHQQDLLHSASLDARISELQDREQQASRTVDEQQQYLASDRDIRELMGARNLYIVDVFDVDPKGQMKKAFGRIFYTKEKSLVFYAFDLDQQRGLRNAAFQAWGRKATGHDVPLNMGIFYLDNEANRRWVLKFDNPEKLEQIDSVFVTVEPKGGSQRPSGKQLLYASLRTRPNHP